MSMGQKIEWFRFVLLGDVGKYLWAGWVIVDDMAGCYHGQFSLIMQWTGEGAPDGQKD